MRCTELLLQHGADANFADKVTAVHGAWGGGVDDAGACLLLNLLTVLPLLLFPRLR
eukprot:COSAG01_NODE_17919_length_1114_cov_1.580296_1_plen_55_part_10